MIEIMIANRWSSFGIMIDRAGSRCITFFFFIGERRNHIIGAGKTKIKIKKSG